MMPRMLFVNAETHRALQHKANQEGLTVNEWASEFYGEAITIHVADNIFEEDHDSDWD